LGGRDADEFIQRLFAGAEYVGVAMAGGPGADFVGDAAIWRVAPLPKFDTVVSVEQLEHTPEGETICLKAHELLDDGGALIVTAASVGRPPHSALDDGPVRHGEFYRNVSPFLLRKWLRPFKFMMVDTSKVGDVYALAVK
jgi:cyclopropane fatty-acyl-phospholipid synthase-like methyltransferase